MYANKFGTTCLTSQNALSHTAVNSVSRCPISERKRENIIYPFAMKRDGKCKLIRCVSHLFQVS